jgi:hypothetical protein
MDTSEQHRLERYRRERVETLASISDIQKGGWRLFKTRGEGHPNIDVTHERINELERTIELLDHLIAQLAHRAA